MIVDDEGSRLFVCSDSDYCEDRREAGHIGGQQAVQLQDALATPALYQTTTLEEAA
jgi:alpha-D-ribose 1-methylphosphonate 5-phosphate C-P lyase